jgi:hypothetical protein
MLKEVYEKPNENLCCTPISCEFESEIIPEYESAEFVLYEFTSRSEEIIFSEPL